jgi:hypothetical protein
MRLHSVVRALASFAGVATLATSAAMADPPGQVQYLPRDGAAIVVWMAPAGNVTGYNVYQSIVDTPTAQPAAPVKVNTDPIKETSFLVQSLKNGTCYHFTVTAIVDGKESAPAGPNPTHRDPPGGTNTCVVPQKPTQLAGAGTAEFYGMTIGTNFPGSHSVAANGAITLKASGWDIWEASDGFYYLATPMAGDITMTARIVSGPTETSDGNGWNLGGPMIRESLDTHSRFAFMQVARDNELQFKKRVTYNETPENDGLGRDDNTARPIWVKLVRKGDDFHAFWSEDGKTYEEVGGGVTIDGFSKEPFVGLALSAHQDGEYSEMVVDNFSITKP